MARLEWNIGVTTVFFNTTGADLDTHLGWIGGALSMVGDHDRAMGILEKPLA